MERAGGEDVMPVRIYQIYFDDTSRAALDPAFVPYCNSGNPEEFEYGVFAREHPRALQEAEYVGFVSWGFGAKTGVRGGELVEFILCCSPPVCGFRPL